VRAFSLKENITIGTQCTSPLCRVSFECHWRCFWCFILSGLLNQSYHYCCFKQLPGLFEGGRNEPFIGC
jgi:hypothetical protein